MIQAIATLFRVLAYIEFRDDAASVRLMRGDLQLWREAIAGTGTLDVKLARVAGIVGHGRLAPPLQPPGEAAHITVVYKWGPRRFRPIYVGRPRAELAVDLSRSAGRRRLPSRRDLQQRLAFRAGRDDTFSVAAAVRPSRWSVPGNRRSSRTPQ